MNKRKLWAWHNHGGVVSLTIGQFWFTYMRLASYRFDKSFILGLGVWLLNIRTGMPYFSERYGYNKPFIKLPYGDHGCRVFVNWRLSRRV